jgi:homoserine O-acetyltransferase
MYPTLVQRAVVMACGAAQSAWQLAISEVQRQSIYRDPEWNLGFYALDAPPVHGLSVARQNAPRHVTRA